MKRIISVIGLGYVGLPVAVAFSEKFEVVAFDINKKRIEGLKNNIDITGEVTAEELRQSNLRLDNNPTCLTNADFHIVAVPTPIDESRQPDLTPVISASKTLAAQLKKGDIVVYESTVYPGVTEEICLPLLEAESGLKGGEDFFVGYSPERINPGDKEHTFKKIMKVVSGQTSEVEEIIAQTYGEVVEAGIHKAGSIKVAEAAKVIENTQRDLNIAFINELSILFNKVGVSTYDVLRAANTKWNFLPFTPGLVGGHCIGVDPYYLTHLAEKLGFHPQVILSGRQTNDSMGKYIAEMAVKESTKLGLPLQNIKLGIFGFTFKENCPDVRNTKVIDIIKELESYQVHSQIYDPVADCEASLEEYNVELASFEALGKLDVVILAVSHQAFLDKKVLSYLKNTNLIIDVKNLLPKDEEFNKVVTL